MNGRVYDPAIGRFLSADPNIPHPYNSQSYNRYSYVLNNPLSLVDPSGFVDTVELPVMTITGPAYDSSLGAFEGMYSHGIRGGRVLGYGDRMSRSEVQAALHQLRAGNKASTSDAGDDFKDASEFEVDGQEFEFIGGTEAEREAIESAARKVFATQLGQYYLSILKERGFLPSIFGSPTFKFDLTVTNAAYTYPYSSTIYMDPSYHPILNTTVGPIPASSVRIIAHELGHAVEGLRDTGRDEMINVRNSENPIMQELGMPARTDY